MIFAKKEENTLTKYYDKIQCGELKNLYACRKKELKCIGVAPAVKLKAVSRGIKRQVF